MEDLRGQTQSGNDLLVPGLRRSVQQIGRRCIGVLVALDSGQTEIEILGDHQQPLGLLQLLRRFLLQGGQLIEGVKGLILDAGPAVQLPGGDDPADDLLHALGTGIPVCHSITDHLILFVQQHKVHTPGVDAYGGGQLAQGLTGLQTAQNAVPQIVHVPAIVTVLVFL